MRILKTMILKMRILQTMKYENFSFEIHKPKNTEYKSSTSRYKIKNSNLQNPKNNFEIQTPIPTNSKIHYHKLQA